MLAVAAASPAAAANQNQDGLVNVAIGDITVQDVNVGVAAVVAATVCNIKVGPVAVLAKQVDAGGDLTDPVCSIEGKDITFTQN
jgi:hypothetical protein